MTTTVQADDTSLKELVCELLQEFHSRGWCNATGGGISARRADGGYWMAPSGVAKERVRPDELFDLDAGFVIQNADELPGRRVSECSPIFEEIYRQQGAGAVIHSHSAWIVLQTRREVLPGEAGHCAWQRLEMLRGIRGAIWSDEHRVPVIPNSTSHAALRQSVAEALQDLPMNAHAVFVQDHGAYIWGADALEAKRHAETYDWLCQFHHLENQR